MSCLFRGESNRQNESRDDPVNERLEATGFRLAGKSLMHCLSNRTFYLPIGLHIVSCARASEEAFRTDVFGAFESTKDGCLLRVC